MTNEERMRIADLQHQGYGYKKIATITGLSQNTVKSYCSRHPVADIGSTEQDYLCRNCKKPLEQTPHKRHKRFCSDACRMAWWNNHPELVQRKAYYTVTCAHCGKQFESYRGRYFWNCTTFQTKGKSECTAKKIPEDTLMALTFEVLGIDRLSTKVVKSKITEIRAEKGNVVVFCIEDGSEIVKRWKDRSRAESWTPEMKEQARQRALQARRKKE